MRARMRRSGDNAAHSRNAKVFTEPDPKEAPTFKKSWDYSIGKHQPVDNRNMQEMVRVTVGLDRTGFVTGICYKADIGVLRTREKIKDTKKNILD